MITVIAATDPVVTLVLAIILPMARASEIFQPSALIGALVIALGAVVAATNFLSPEKEKAKETDGIEGQGPLQEEYVIEESDNAVLSTSDGTEKKKSFKDSPLYGFLAVTVLFAAMGMSINNLNLFAGGFSELRPVNLIPVPAGILLGPAGALGCACGNFIQDLFSDYGYARIFGLAANFLAAYLPYKMWQVAVGSKKDTLHVHTRKNMFVFLWAVLLSSLASSFVLYFGLEIFFKARYRALIRGALANNILFSLAFGLPCFIVLTMKDSGFKTGAFEIRPRCGLRIFEGLNKYLVPILFIDTILISACLAVGYMGAHWINNMAFRVFVTAVAIMIVVTCLIPNPSQSD